MLGKDAEIHTQRRIQRVQKEVSEALFKASVEEEETLRIEILLGEEKCEAKQDVGKFAPCSAPPKKSSWAFFFECKDALQQNYLWSARYL